MFTLTAPNERTRTAFRLTQSRLAYSYAAVDCTRTEECPKGYVEDRTTVSLGHGPDVFHAACDALKSWAQFPAGWTRVDPTNAPFAEGTVVTMTARTFGLYTLNSCRIVYTINEPKCFGYAYGTLPGHVARGEERFQIVMTNDGEVRYEILAYSRPCHWLARIGYPLARLAQARFRRDSCAAMVAAVKKRAVPV
jgi:uncharacterized protein (UPF0548 family)